MSHSRELVTLANGKKSYQKKPSKEIIARFTDNSVPVVGKYSLVKLPIKTGVKLWNPTAIVRDSKDIMWVANYTGEIYSLHDTDGDGLEDHAELFCDVKTDKLRYPTSMAWHKGELYVGTTQEIRAYKDTDGDLKSDSSRVFFKDFPWTLHPFDWTFALEFGPDNHAYVIFCTDYLNRQRAKDPKKYRGAIVRISPNGKAEIFATGARYAYGMAFNQDGDLFYSDNKSGGNPTDEINFAQKGKYYGHNPKKYPNQKTVKPFVNIKQGFGPGGLEFNSLKNDFGGTAGNLFLACWGPDGKWSRGSLVRVEITKQSDGSYKGKEYLVADKFAKIIDVKFSQAGDLYIAQFGREGRRHTPYKQAEGAIYRMIHSPWKVAPLYTGELKGPFVKGDIENGKKLFQGRCALCHDSESLAINKLGPPLKGIGDMFSKNEILTAINEPSRGIKTDYETHEIIKKDGTKLIGRVSSVNDKGVNLMLAGNAVIFIKISDIKSQKMLEQSLMPAGLLKGLSSKEIDDLFSYMKIRTNNLARYAKVSSPDGLKNDGTSGGDIAINDGNINTYLDKEDNKGPYIIQLDFKDKIKASEIIIKAFAHHKFSPKSFEIIADYKVIKSGTTGILVGF